MTEHTISHAEDLFSGDAWYAGARAKRGIPLSKVLLIALGSPLVADPNFICESQANGEAKTLTLTNTVLDVPRIVTVDADDVGTAVLTITGKDEYGEVMVEEITMDGTTEVPGLKAFKTITSVTTNASSTGDIIVGFGDVLGLPYRVDENGFLMAYADGALDLTTSAVLGTLVAAVTATPTATTGDVRGTYNPNTTLDDTVEFAVLVKIASTATKVGAYGADQYAG